MSPLDNIVKQAEEHPSHVILVFINPLLNKLILMHVLNVFLDIFVMKSDWTNRKTVLLFITVHPMMRLLTMETAMAVIPVTVSIVAAQNSDVLLGDIQIQKISGPKLSVLHALLETTAPTLPRMILNLAFLVIIAPVALQLEMKTVAQMVLTMPVTTVPSSVLSEHTALKVLSLLECVSKELSQEVLDLNPMLNVTTVNLGTFAQEKSLSMDHLFFIVECLVSVKLDMHVNREVSAQMGS